MHACESHDRRGGGGNSEQGRLPRKKASAQDQGSEGCLEGGSQEATEEGVRETRGKPTGWRQGVEQVLEADPTLGAVAPSIVSRLLGEQGEPEGCTGRQPRSSVFGKGEAGA